MSDIFAGLTAQPEDKILELMQLFRDDPRPEKIDLGVGVYRNADGVTPVMRAVKAAEKAWAEAEVTKAYTGLIGTPDFGRAVVRLVLGPDADMSRIAFAAQPGGTGAVHRALEIAKLARPGMTLWLPDPTWPNHPAIAAHLGIEVRTYRYLDDETRAVDMTGLIEDLGAVAPGDVVLVHGCCHNPSGADPSPADWDEIASLLEARGAVAMVDLAYLGFGDGIEPDAAATRMLAERLPEVLICVSGSKNFGLYRDRAGMLIALGRGADQRALLQSNLASLNRLNFSFPPDHGARLMTLILEDETLRADWEAELAEMREGINGLRRSLATALREGCGSDRFGFLAQHRGMFSRLGATPEQVAALRKDHAVYMVGDSRMNIAGLAPRDVPRLAEAILAAGV